MERIQKHAPKLEFTKEGYAQEKRYEEKLVRILSEDIGGGMNVYAGLTKVKGISWGLSNALCKILKINKITEFIKNPSIPKFIFNRRNDFETGRDKHLIGTDLELQTEFDIKRMK